MDAEIMMAEEQRRDHEGLQESIRAMKMYNARRESTLRQRAAQIGQLGKIEERLERRMD